MKNYNVFTCLRVGARAGTGFTKHLHLTSLHVLIRVGKKWSDSAG